MATTNQIKALIKSHIVQDDEQFLALALQIATHSAQHGYSHVATEIKALVDEARLRTPFSSTHHVVGATPQGELAELLAVSIPETRLSEVVFDSGIRKKLERVLREYRASATLSAHGLGPTRKLLLAGAPCTGKSMTAAALSRELNLPLYTVLSHALVTSFFGKTTTKLRLVFNAIAENRGVYLFDEFAAIGFERAAGNDVEIRRVLNSFLQFLEQDESRSLIIATTTHPQAFDTALFRRFDAIIEYPLPTSGLALEAIFNRLAPFDTSALERLHVGNAANGLNYADIAAACDMVTKNAVLDDARRITTEDLVSALRERQKERQGYV